MASTIFEFFGYPVGDQSNQANSAIQSQSCAILGQKCVKSFNDGVVSGVCSIKPITSSPVICCPIRLYFSDYKILTDISSRVFGSGMKLIAGKDAVAFAKTHSTPCVAVFGKGWGGELRLPQKSNKGGYFVDWVLAKIDNKGDLVEFIAVEVQTIDTTGSYRSGYEDLLSNGKVSKTTAGLNWENVAKRILPQLIYKGQILQREALCRSGLFFVCPRPVYERIMLRLGGEQGLIKYALQPASITFAVYDYDAEAAEVQGEVRPISETLSHSTTVYKVQEAFNNVTLPEENVYRDAILKALGT